MTEPTISPENALHGGFSTAPSQSAAEPFARRRRAGGFSLIELAIVLAVMGVVLSAALPALMHWQSQRRYAQTETRLDAAQFALLGFAMQHRRVPCPATATSHGAEDCSAIGNVLPVATLGLDVPVDALGQGLDGWGSPLRYFVGQVDGESLFTNAAKLALSNPSEWTPSLALRWSGSCGNDAAYSDQLVAVVVAGNRRLSGSLDAVTTRPIAGVRRRGDGCGFDNAVRQVTTHRLLLDMVYAGSWPAS